jgi:flagellar hook protein FlgE
MIEGMYAAISGLQANQTMLDVTANNLANLNTAGYKSESVDFANSLSQIYRGASASTPTLGGTNPIAVGVGVSVAGVDTDESVGTLQSTGNPLDIAIEGPGYLQVGDAAAGSVPSPVDYTRAGNLTINSAGYLTTQSGQYVVGVGATGTGTGASETYAPNTTPVALAVPTTASNVAIGDDGSVTYTSASTGYTVTAGYIQLATFPNDQGLQSIGDNLYTSSPNSGTAILGQPGTTGFGQTVSGEIESSNVDLATEFTNMITAQRGYQANAQVITTANQMLQTLEQITTA